jgi:hypothetical protein
MVNGDFIYAIPEALVGKFSAVLIIIQAVGWAVLIYILFSIINALINRRRNVVVERISSQLEEIKEILKEKKVLTKN